MFFLLLSGHSFINDPKEPGDLVDDFTLKNHDGTEFTLGKIIDVKAIVIMFWSTECPYVQPYTDRINSLAEEFRKKGFVFWAINSNSTESAEDVKEHALKNKYPFPVLKDENNVVADLFGASKTPEIFVLDPFRTVLYHGRIDDSRDITKVTSNDLMNALSEINKGKEVSIKSTKSFGCTIKRKEK
jgi:peroxiredoxin